jgi:hypothetical protein
VCTGLHDLNSAPGANQWVASLQASMMGIFISGGMIFLCGVIGKLVFRKDTMGFGDVKLMGVIGGFLGWKLAVATFFLAPFFGLLFGMPGLISKKGKIIPYGPFLSLAAFICLLFKDATVGIIDNYLDVYVNLFLYLFLIFCIFKSFRAIIIGVKRQGYEDLLILEVSILEEWRCL